MSRTQPLRTSRCLIWIALAAAVLLAGPAVCPHRFAAQEPEAEAERSTGLPNIVTKTLGGRQFWGDIAVFHQWRIQRNVLTGHYRLLDGDDYRHAWGTLPECLHKLEEIKTQRRLPPMQGKAVILVHGLMRSSKSFDEMTTALQEAGYLAVPFAYPSGRVDVQEATEYLRSVIASLEGIEQIHFVTHSLGGLVVRNYLAAPTVDPRVQSLVMVGVPNRGAELADMFEENPVFRLVTGPAGQQLNTDPEGFVAQLAKPEIPFAVIAGGRGNTSGYNPLIPGDDDGTVAVESTRLRGAADSSVVASRHFSLANHPDTIAQTLRFLQSGRLRDEGPAVPIPDLP
jgi:pimeloyl-ACP methyl ester carboxylesterase